MNDRHRIEYRHIIRRRPPSLTWTYTKRILIALFVLVCVVALVRHKDQSYLFSGVPDATQAGR